MDIARWIPFYNSLSSETNILEFTSNDRRHTLPAAQSIPNAYFLFIPSQRRIEHQPDVSTSILQQEAHLMRTNLPKCPAPYPLSFPRIPVQTQKPGDKTIGYRRCVNVANILCIHLWPRVSSTVKFPRLSSDVCILTRASFWYHCWESSHLTSILLHQSQSKSPPGWDVLPDNLFRSPRRRCRVDTSDRTPSSEDHLVQQTLWHWGYHPVASSRIVVTPTKKENQPTKDAFPEYDHLNWALLKESVTKGDRGRQFLHRQGFTHL